MSIVLVAPRLVCHFVAGRFPAGSRLRRRVLCCLGVSTLSFVSCAVLALAEGLSANFLFNVTMVLVLTSGMSIAVMQVGRIVTERNVDYVYSTISKGVVQAAM